MAVLPRASHTDGRDSFPLLSLIEAGLLLAASKNFYSVPFCYCFNYDSTTCSDNKFKLTEV